MSHRLIRLAVLSIFLVAGASSALASPRSLVLFFVSPSGSDTNPGTKDKPFKTIERGLKATRALNAKDPHIFLASGIYELAKPIVLDKRDDGVVLIGKNDKAPARLIGGKIVKKFKPLTDKVVLAKLPAAAKGKILVADLKAQGITDYGKLKAVGFGRGGTAAMELFVNGGRQTLARYPNVGWLTIASIPGGQMGKTITANLPAARLAKWNTEAEPWLFGYWYHGWADRFVPVTKIDAKTKTFTLDKLHSYGLRKGQRFFAQNLLCELDSPGEYYIDRAAGTLYYWPTKTDKFEAIVSMLESPIIQVRGGKDIILSELAVEAGRSGGIHVKDSSSVRVRDCHIRNVGETGVAVSGGKKCNISRNEIHDTGASGISLNGGDRKTLTPSHHIATENHIHHVSRLRRTYTPAISISGVGNSATNNLLHHMPHNAIHFNGNDHDISRNEIHHAVLETDDAGAIYTCPRDYTSRGTSITHNYLHHCGPHHAPKIPAELRTEPGVVYDPMHIHGTTGIYLDDLTGGMLVEGNIIEDAYRAFLIGGGRDNTIKGNLVLGGTIGIWIDGRGLGWAGKYVNKGGAHGFFRKYAEMKGDQPPYVTRYPGLKTALTDNPAAPVNTVASGNIVLGAKQWKRTDGKSDKFIKFVNNHNGPRPKLPANATPKQWLDTVDPAILKQIGFGKISFPLVQITKPNK